MVMTYGRFNSTVAEGSLGFRNPPLLTGDQPIGAPRNWIYYSTHAASVVVSSTHISDGRDIGMKAGDYFTSFETNSTLVGAGVRGASATLVVTTHFVTRVAATSVNLSTGTILSSAT